MALRRFGIVGDSVSAGWIWAHDTADGGPGAWWELLAERLANIQGVGPRIGSGFRAVSLNDTYMPDFNATPEWVFTGTWTRITQSTSDKGLYGYTYYTTAGTSAVATYTVPTRWRKAKYIQLYYIATAGMGDWSMRFTDTAGNIYSNAGVQWFNLNATFGITIAHDLNIHALFIDLSGLASGALGKLEIRGPTGGNTVMPAGIELFSSDPHTTDGLIVDNYAQSGRQLHELVDTTSGSDRMALFDSVVRETSSAVAGALVGGAAVANRPTLGVLMEHGNDDKNNDTTQFAADLTTFYNRIHPISPQIWWNGWEYIPPRGDGSGIDITWQANYRAQLKTTADALGVPWFDMFDTWSLRGWTNNLKTFNAGVLDIDSNHESAYGHRPIAEALYPFVRKNLIGQVDASRPALTVTQAKTVGGNEVGGMWGTPEVVAGLQNGALRVSPEPLYA